jgi:hydrogenase nickel incorporation protein HypA/HybF
VHEVSIMMSVLDTALEVAKKESAQKIICIKLKIGEKSGVVEDCLRFAFESVRLNTIAEEAKLEIELIPWRGRCLGCGLEFKADSFLICERCGKVGKPISGQELQIKSIEVE